MKLIPLSEALKALAKLPEQERLVEYSFNEALDLVLVIHADFNEIVTAYEAQLQEERADGAKA